MEILIVEDEPITAAIERRMLMTAGHDVTIASDGLQALDLFRQHRYPVIISDWNMPGMIGTELCRRIREDDSQGYTYFILGTSRDKREDQLAAMEAGADDFLVKPFDPTDLSICLRNAERILAMQKQLRDAQSDLEKRVEERTAELARANAALSQQIVERRKAEDEVRAAYAATIEGWSRALELRDKDTEGHTQRVTEITLHLGERAGFTETQLYHVRHGALLHDIGKMGVPDDILLKPGKLTMAERSIVEEHPGLAYELLRPIAFLRDALAIPYSHHERWDGAGYPQGLRGEQIPIEARLFAISDVYDALRADRPYRKGLPFDEVVEYIKNGAGSQFDPAGVELFMEMIRDGELQQIEAKYPYLPSSTSPLHLSDSYLKAA